jgi:transposase
MLLSRSTPLFDAITKKADLLPENRACVCPGNQESAGQRKSGRTRKGNRWLRGLLNQMAWGGSAIPKAPTSGRNSGAYADYRGEKRALWAVSIF